MGPARILLLLERARKKLMAIDPNDRKKLLAVSRKVDELVVEYYRAKSSFRQP